MEINRDFVTTNGSYSWNDPTHVVVHYTGGAGRAAGETARANALCYYLGNVAYPCGAHYFVGDDGIYASTDELRGAWTCGNYGANTHHISIEVVAGDGEGFSPREVGLLGELVRDVMRRHGIPAERVIRHHDVVDVFTSWRTADPHKACPEAYIDEGAWRELHARITGQAGTHDTQTDEIGDMQMVERALITAPEGRYYWDAAARKLSGIESDGEYESLKGLLGKDGSVVPEYKFDKAGSVGRIRAVLAR